MLSRLLTRSVTPPDSASTNRSHRLTSCIQASTAICRTPMSKYFETKLLLYAIRGRAIVAHLTVPGTSTRGQVRRFHQHLTTSVKVKLLKVEEFG